MSKIYVLRLGHRRDRDKRITTHVGLVARAFGANGIVLSGEYDSNVIKSLKKVVINWGGPFDVLYEDDWRKFMLNWRKEGWIVHLTMYGLNINDTIDQIKSMFYENQKLLLVVGAEKVPREVYEIADYNIGIGNQPHSEVAALAVFLDRLFEGQELYKEFKDAKLKIIPQTKGKKVIKILDQ